MGQARATTEEEAASLALSLLREPGVASFNEQNDRARASRKWFGTARDEILRSRDWNFATAWATPARDLTDSIGILKKRYRLPADCLKVRFVNDLEQDEWAVETGTIDQAGVQTPAAVLVTNSDAPLICYTKVVDLVRLWDTQFLLAFARRLAELMAGEFGKSAGDIQQLGALAEETTDRAARTDAREQAPSTYSRDTSWTAARRGFRRSIFDPRR